MPHAHHGLVVWNFSRWLVTVNGDAWLEVSNGSDSNNELEVGGWRLWTRGGKAADSFNLWHIVITYSVSHVDKVSVCLRPRKYGYWQARLRC
jgi:hypothetical protein